MDSDWYVQMLDSGGAMVLFGMLVIASFGMLLLALMFFLLAVRGCWRWLTRHTWGDVIRSAERRAMK